jgi:hypothetical protein
LDNGLRLSVTPSQHFAANTLLNQLTLQSLYKGKR